MNKLEELKALKAKVAALETELTTGAQSQIDALAKQIDSLFLELTAVAKDAGLTPRITVGGNQIDFDGYSWRPSYNSDWYSSSADC
jgi:hypothetical protein